MCIKCFNFGRALGSLIPLLSSPVSSVIILTYLWSSFSSYFYFKCYLHNQVRNIRISLWWGTGWAKEKQHPTKKNTKKTLNKTNNTTNPCPKKPKPQTKKNPPYHHHNERYHNTLSSPKGTNAARRITLGKWILLCQCPAHKLSESLLKKKQLN